MKITIEVIPNEKHLYPTVGDWRFDAWGDLQIKVSKMSDERYEQLVAIHELIETLLCKIRGIKEEDVSAFDVMFEKERDEGKHSEDEEPGFDDRAPYKKEHSFATEIEKMIAKEMGVDWEKYNKEVNEL